MVDRPEPFIYPNRNRFPFDPGIPNRQLWAIGMVVVQWSMTETVVSQLLANGVAAHPELHEELSTARSAKSRLDLWKKLVDLDLEPRKSRGLEFVTRTQQLNSDRDEVIHRLWGGGMEGTSWFAEGFTQDAALMRKPGDKFKTKSEDARATLHWRLTFARLRRMAVEMATHNRDLMQFAFLPH